MQNKLFDDFVCPLEGIDEGDDIFLRDPNNQLNSIRISKTDMPVLLMWLQERQGYRLKWVEEK